MVDQDSAWRTDDFRAPRQQLVWAPGQGVTATTSSWQALEGLLSPAPSPRGRGACGALATPLDQEKNPHGQSRKNSMVDPGKIHGRYHGVRELTLTPWSIHKNSMADLEQIHGRSRNKSMIDPEIVISSLFKSRL